MKLYYVYILKCSDNSYYTGIINDLERRIAEHNEGTNPFSYTFSRRPLKLVFFETFPDPNQAINFEKKVKGWSRKKKEAIINGNWNDLKELTKCKNKTSHMFYNKKQDNRSS